MSDPFGTALSRLAERLQKRRLDLDLSQEHVAHEAGISTRQYQYIEGARSAPKLSTLYAIAVVLEVDVADLLAGTMPTPRRRRASKAGAPNSKRSR